MAKEVKVIGLDSRHSMDVMTDEELKMFCECIPTLYRDKKLYVSKVDYWEGTVTFGYIHNMGTPSEFYDDDFHKVNVAAESVGCMFWECVNSLFKRLM